MSRRLHLSNAYETTERVTLAALTDLDPVGTTVIGSVTIAAGALFTLLVNALLKLASQSDEINRRATVDKQVTIDALHVEVAQLKQERDYWFGKFDDCRAGRPIDKGTT